MKMTVVGLILITGIAQANPVNCGLSLEGAPSKVQGGLIIQRVAPVIQARSEAESKAVKLPALPAIPVIQFGDRVRMARTLHQSGIFMSPEFGDMLDKTLGTYADLIRNNDNSENSRVDVPYEDIARSLLKQLTQYYLSDSFTSVGARLQLQGESKTHYDLTNIKYVSKVSKENPDFNNRAVVLANALIDVGEENMVLSLKEMTIHVLGAVINFHEQNRQNIQASNKLENAVELKKENMSFLNSVDFPTGRGWFRGMIAVGGIVGAFAAGVHFGFWGVGVEALLGSYATIHIPKLDYYSLLLDKNEASEKIGRVQRSFQNTISQRINYNMRNAEPKKKIEWFSWLKGKVTESAEIPDLSLDQSKEGPLDALSLDLEDLKKQMSQIEYSLQEISNGSGNTLNVGLLEQVTLKTNSLLAMSLMVLENELDFGALSHIQTLGAKLTKARTREEFSTLSVSAQQLLFQVQAQLDSFEKLLIHLMSLRSFTGSYARLISANLDSQSAVDLVEPLDFSAESLEDGIRTITTTKQNMISLKLALTSFGNINASTNVNRLSSKMIESHDALRNSLPGMQICMSGGTQRCTSVNTPKPRGIHTPAI